ncbi:MAG: hypothetical protein M3R25_05480 [Bacteroidota bacterium]|nr:hypothetical protein [Bacteroidota bacterium]
MSQFVYFQYEYKNGAWGTQHEGWYIDQAGKISRYELPENWIEPDSMGFISEE